MVSKLIRRVHMYLALFLVPWVLMYALSTFVMNHRAFFRKGNAPPAFETIRELEYQGTFPEAATPAQIALQLLSDLGLDGAHNVGRPAADGSMAIQRHDLVTPKRIVWSPTDRKLRIEQQTHENAVFLERFHRRRGYQPPYALDKAWAFTVDLAAVTIVFWVLSGLWMWWEMKNTRRLGAVFSVAGLALFVVFLVMI
jgi:hypothetical protein